MADERNNQDERMDERSRGSGAGGGGGGGMSGRNDGGGESRSTTNIRKTPRGFAAMDPQAQR
ncbi:MAG TPA: hypothetical protein VGO75_03915, partial [Gemmatimonadaceae bacterium]|nr:hypothetical protein [Gemmatimonadaceae bacterium]